MHYQNAMSAAVREALRCPVCKSRIECVDERYRCVDPRCGGNFPKVNGIPVLINERSSVFRIADLIHPRNINPGLKRKVKDMANRLLPSLTANVSSEKNYDKFAKCLLSSSSTPIVLVIGGQILGKGMEALTANPAIELVESDVAFGPQTTLICDAHDLLLSRTSLTE